MDLNSISVDNMFYDIKIEYSAYEFIEELMNDFAVKELNLPAFPVIFLTPRSDGKLYNENIGQACRLVLTTDAGKVIMKFKESEINTTENLQSFGECSNFRRFFTQLKKAVFKKGPLFTNIQLYLAFSVQIGIYFTTEERWKICREFLIREIFHAMRDEFLILHSPTGWGDFMRLMNSCVRYGLECKDGCFRYRGITLRKLFKYLFSFDRTTVFENISNV